MERSPGEDAFSIDELSHARAVAEFLADDIDSRDAAYDANSLDERGHGQFALSVAELGHTSALVEPLAEYAPDSLDEHIRSEFELSVEERGHSRVVAEHGHVPDSLDGAYGTKSVDNNLVISLDDVYVMDSLPDSVDNTCITESLA